MMRAVIVEAFTPFDQATVGERPPPVAGPGEVVVALEAVDTNFPDILFIEGRYQHKPALPFSPGLAGAGRVIAQGAGVSVPRLGQKVLVLPEYGTYAEQIAASAAHCLPLPESMPFETAAAFGLVYQTAYLALTERARVTPADRVLVLGASGGVGMAAVQLARALGARQVLAATRGPAGAAFARDLGADVTIDAAMPDLRNGLRAAVQQATEGHGVDVVIDPVGGALSAASLRAMAWCGRLVVIGFASGEVPQIGANYLLVKNIAALGIQWTDYRARTPHKVRAAQDHINGLWQQGVLGPKIEAVLPLARYGSALAALSGGTVRGKIILTTTPDTETSHD